MANTYNIKPVALSFGSKVIATATRLQIRISYIVGGGGSFSYQLLDNLGNKVHEVEQPIPVDSFGNYSDQAALSFALNELGLSLETDG